MTRPWTDDQYKTAKLLKSKGKTYKQIAEILGRPTGDSVSSYMQARAAKERMVAKPVKPDRLNYEPNAPITCKKGDELLAALDTPLWYEDIV